MSSLTVSSAPGLGPLDVSVYPPDGDPIEFTLSSGRDSNAMTAQAGRYTVVARRPDGTRIRQSATVSGEDAVVELAAAAEPAKPEPPAGGRSPAPPPMSQPSVLTSIFGTLLSRSFRAATSSLTASRPPVVLGAPSRSETVGQRLTLTAWALTEGRWRPLDSTGFLGRSGRVEVSDDRLTITLEPRDGVSSPSGQAVCLGLRDNVGFGPMVIMPPFAGTVTLTFLASGVATRADDRTVTPGQQRMPVARFTPSTPAIADFLAALAAPLTPDSDAIWRQAASTITDSGSVDAALEELLNKFNRPAEALVAAHYLLRFLPNRLPLQWGENLSRAIEIAADGPAIAAWCWIYNRPQDASDEAVDKAVAINVALALQRPVTLLARTRALLSEAQHLVAIPDAAERWRMQERFRRSGAAAGGLECFWGRGPDSPGKGDAVEAPPLDEVSLVAGAFRYP